MKCAVHILKWQTKQLIVLLRVFTFQYDNKTPLRSFALTILGFFFQKMKLKATFLESFCAATSSAHLVCTPFSMRASLSAPSVR